MNADQEKCAATLYINLRKLLTLLIILALSKIFQVFVTLNIKLECWTDYIFHRKEQVKISGGLLIDYLRNPSRLNIWPFAIPFDNKRPAFHWKVVSSCS